MERHFSDKTTINGDEIINEIKTELDKKHSSSSSVRWTNLESGTAAVDIADAFLGGSLAQELGDDDNDDDGEPGINNYNH